MTLMFLTCVNVPSLFFFSFPSLLCETLLQESVQHHPAALAFIILDDNFLDN